MEDLPKPFAHLLEAKNPTLDILKFKVPLDQVNITGFRMNQTTAIEGWIMDQIRSRAETRPYTMESLNQDLPDDAPIFELQGFMDPDRVEHEFFGQIQGWVTAIPRTKEARVWLGFRSDRFIQLLPEEEFKFDVEKMASTDPVIFMREFSRHPNHAVLLAAVMALVTLKGVGMQPGWFRALVYRIRVMKRGALQRLLYQAKDYTTVENVLFEMGIPLIDE